ncbi:MAG TPA: hypothetical protein VGJ78_01925 [Vicinamibacterales bacterium]
MDEQEESADRSDDQEQSGRNAEQYETRSEHVFITILQSPAAREAQCEPVQNRAPLVTPLSRRVMGPQIRRIGVASCPVTSVPILELFPLVSQPLVQIARRGLAAIQRPGRCRVVFQVRLPPRELAPPLGDDEPPIHFGQLDHFADTMVGQVDSIDAVRQLSDDAYTHTSRN